MKLMNRTPIRGALRALVMLMTALLPATPVPLAGQEGLRLEQIDFRALPLDDALRLISRETGLKIVASREARDIPISLYLEDVSGAEALEALATSHGLWMSGQPGREIVRIHTSDEYARDIGTLREEETAIFTLRYPNARDVALSIRDLFGDRVVLARRVDDREDPGEFELEDLNRRLQRFDTIDARGQGFGIFDTSPGIRGRRGDSFFGRRSAADRLRSGRRDFRERDRAPLGERLQELTPQEIAQLESTDDMAREEAIERLLRSRADIFVTVIDRLNKVMVRTRDQRTMDEIRSLVGSLDVPTALVLLEIRILQVDLERGLDTAFEWSFSDLDGSGVDMSLSPGGRIENPTLVFSLLDDRFRGSLELLQTQGRVTSLGRPTLLTANNEVSRIFIGQEVPLNRGFDSGETIVTPGGPVVVPGSTQIEFRPVGATLLITPNINQDGTVTLRILQEESRINKGGADILVPDGEGGFVNRSLDTVASQTASGTFAAYHGQTVAIGGLIREEMIERRSQFPLLGDIPVLGMAFRSTTSRRERSEIVLLMTPHIISTPGEGEAVTMPVIEQNMLHPRRPDGRRGLELFEEDHVIHPPTDEYDWDAYWRPRLPGRGAWTAPEDDHQASPQESSPQDSSSDVPHRMERPRGNPWRR